MSKIIAVYGAPWSGKTIMSAALCKAIGNMGKESLLISVDIDTPMLPVLAPKAEARQSLGKVLAKGVISSQDILKELYTQADSHVGILAYRLRDVETNYPKYDREKVKELLERARGIADFIVIDCISDSFRPFTATALQVADIVILMAAPDTKGLSWYDTQIDCILDVSHKSKVCINCRADCKYDLLQLKYKYSADYTIPFDKSLPETIERGEIVKKQGKRFERVAKDICKAH